MTAALRASASMIKNALSAKSGIVETPPRATRCAGCGVSGRNAHILLKNNMGICMACTQEAMGDTLPKDSRTWTVETVAAKLSGTRDQRLQALVACRKHGASRNRWSGDLLMADLYTDRSLFLARLVCLTWAGQEFEDILLRSILRDQVANLFNIPDLADALLSLSPASAPSRILGALEALPLHPGSLSDKIRWLNQWQNSKDQTVRPAVLDALKQLGYEDFVDPDLEEDIDEITESLLIDYLADELKQLATYVKSVSGVPVTAGGKEAIARRLAVHFAQPGAAARFYSQIPEQHRQLVNALIWQRYPVRPDDLLRETGIAVVVEEKQGRYYSRVELKSEYGGLLELSSYYDARRVRLYPWFKQLLRGQVPLPPGADLSGAAAPPENSRMVPFDSRFLNVTPAIETVFFQNALPTKMSGLPTVAALRQLAELGGYAEFFPDIRELEHERGNLIFRLLLQLQKPDVPRTDPEQTLRAWLDTIFGADPEPDDNRRNGSAGRTRWNMAACLGHLKGAGKYDYSQVDQYNAAILRELIKALPADNWVGIGDVFGHMLCHDRTIAVPDGYLDAYTAVPNGGGGRQRFCVHEAPEMLYERPLVQSMFMLMAAIGILEVAVRKPLSPFSELLGKEYMIPGDGLVAVRATPLAQWYFHNAKLDSFQSTAEGTISLDERRLLIRLSGEDPVLKTILSRVADPVARSTYRVSPATFLRSCRTPDDILEKVNSLETILPDDLPPVWKRFFADIQTRIDPIKPASYRVFKLGDSPELSNLFLTDPKLAACALKAEGGHILVSSAKRKQLQARLAELGYFVGKL